MGNLTEKIKNEIDITISCLKKLENLKKELKRFYFVYSFGHIYEIADKGEYHCEKMPEYILELCKRVLKDFEGNNEKHFPISLDKNLSCLEQDKLLMEKIRCQYFDEEFIEIYEDKLDLEKKIAGFLQEKDL